MMKWIIITLAVHLLFFSQTTSMSVTKRSNNIQICGRLLAETLNLLCGGQYYDPEEENDISKRDVALQTSAGFYPSWLLRLSSPKLNEFSHQYPFSRRQERGVVDDCCRKACTVSVLMSYCRNSK